MVSGRLTQVESAQEWPVPGEAEREQMTRP